MSLDLVVASLNPPSAFGKRTPCSQRLPLLKLLQIVQNVSQIAGGAKQLFNTLFNMAQRVDDLIFATEKGSLNPVTIWGNQATPPRKVAAITSSVLSPQASGLSLCSDHRGHAGFWSLTLLWSRRWLVTSIPSLNTYGGQARYSLARLYNPRPGLSGRSRKLGLHRGSAMTSSITGPLHALLLSLLDIKPVIWTVRDSPFHIKMPPEEEIGEVVNYVKLVTPSIKDKDHGKFSFYKPPLDRPIRVSHSLSGFQLTQKDLGNPLFIPLTIGEVFQEKGADCRFDVDIIVHVDSGENGGVILRTSPADSSNSWLQYVTFRLRNQDEAQLPPETELDANMIIEVPNEALPKFVEQLELESRLRRSPHWHDIKTLPLLDFKGAYTHLRTLVNLVVRYLSSSSSSMLSLKLHLTQGAMVTSLAIKTVSGQTSLANLFVNANNFPRNKNERKVSFLRLPLQLRTTILFVFARWPACKYCGHMRKALEPRIHAHFERKKLADPRSRIGLSSTDGPSWESGRARSGGHLTVDFCKLDGKLITTHHVYPSDEAYEGKGG
ncbi:hypothetical protein H4582DRAFT_2054663 [Lactarius indigo]|nr:hypothetical protein H4582DRAFT_2054663 [Lactarius indigo]